MERLRFRIEGLNLAQQVVLYSKTTPWRASPATQSNPGRLNKMNTSNYLVGFLVWHQATLTQTLRSNLRVALIITTQADFLQLGLTTFTESECND
jgi:hypothetical protein